MLNTYSTRLLLLSRTISPAVREVAKVPAKGVRPVLKKRITTMGNKEQWTIAEVLIFLTLLAILMFLTIFRYINLSGRKLGYHINYRLCEFYNEPLPENPFKEKIS